VRFGYDGRPFYGWARQPGLHTVEGTLRDGIVRCGIAADADHARLDVASRTDRGVSARANALALTSGLEGRALLHALNGITPEIVFTAARPVRDSFRPRAVRSRSYRYYEVAPRGSLAAYRAAARPFEGVIDVRSLGRGLPIAPALVRAVTRCRVVRDPPGFRFDIEAPSFVWGMVRKIVASVRSVVAGELEPKTLADAVAGRRRLTLPLAEAEPLVLWEVEYDEPWEVTATDPKVRRRPHFQAELVVAHTRARVMNALNEGTVSSAAKRSRPTARRARPARSTVSTPRSRSRAPERVHEP
jgi:tRNA pseudouridine38-40 synthase